MMYKELKVLIINWLLDHENEWQRVNACRENFREYIYNSEGEYLIGGEEVEQFIIDADNLLYAGRKVI